MATKTNKKAAGETLHKMPADIKKALAKMKPTQGIDFNLEKYNLSVLDSISALLGG